MNDTTHRAARRVAFTLTDADTPALEKRVRAVLDGGDSGGDGACRRTAAPRVVALSAFGAALLLTGAALVRPAAARQDAPPAPAAPFIPPAVVPSSPTDDGHRACVRNLQRLAMATIKYVKDHDEKLPPFRSSAALGNALAPYTVGVGGKDSATEKATLFCPATGKHYALNTALNGRTHPSIEQVTRTFLLRDAAPHPDGRAHAAYADGHVSAPPPSVPAPPTPPRVLTPTTRAEREVSRQRVILEAKRRQLVELHATALRAKARRDAEERRVRAAAARAQKEQLKVALVRRDRSERQLAALRDALRRTERERALAERRAARAGAEAAAARAAAAKAARS